MGTVESLEAWLSQHNDESWISNAEWEILRGDIEGAIEQLKEKSDGLRIGEHIPGDGQNVRQVYKMDGTPAGRCMILPS